MNGIDYTAVTEQATVIVKLFVVSSKSLMKNVSQVSSTRFSAVHASDRNKEKHD